MTTPATSTLPSSMPRRPAAFSTACTVTRSRPCSGARSGLASLRGGYSPPPPVSSSIGSASGSHSSLLVTGTCRRCSPHPPDRRRSSPVSPVSTAYESPPAATLTTRAFSRPRRTASRTPSLSTSRPRPRSPRRCAIRQFRSSSRRSIRSHTRAGPLPHSAPQRCSRKPRASCASPLGRR